MADSVRALQSRLTPSSFIIRDGLHYKKPAPWEQDQSTGTLPSEDGVRPVNSRTRRLLAK